MSKHGRRNLRTQTVKGIFASHAHRKRAKSQKKTCALCEKMLHGVPHGQRVAGVKRLSKSQRRPTGLFGGILCSHCRQDVIEEAVRIRTGAKMLDDVLLSEKNFVEQALAHINKGL